MVALLVYWVIAAAVEIWLAKKQLDEGVDFALSAFSQLGDWTYLLISIFSAITFPYTLYQILREYYKR